MLREAERLIQAGFAVLLLKRKTKIPLDLKWTSLPVETYRELERRYDGHNLGVRLGEPSEIAGQFLHCIDIDIRDDRAIDEALKTARRYLPNIEKMPTVMTGSGGESRHVYFVSDKAFKSRKLAHSKDKITGQDDKPHWAWEIELFGTGKQVVIPPSIHPDTGKPYRWSRPFDTRSLDLGVPPRPQIASRTIKGWEGVTDRREDTDDGDALQQAVRQAPTSLSVKQIERLLEDAPRDWVDDYETWMKVGMALHHEFNGGDEGLDLWHWYSKVSDKYEADVLDDKWESFKGNKNPTTLRTLIKAAKEERRKRNMEDIDFRDADEPDEEDDWRRRLDVDAEGMIKNTVANMAVILQHDPRLKGCIEHNDLLERPVTRKPLPRVFDTMSSRSIKNAIDGDPWEDGHDADLRVLISGPRTKKRGGYGLPASIDKLKDAILVTAHKNRFNPVIEYLDGLKWDHKPRVEDLFVNYLGSDDTPYHRTAAHHMLIAAVTRVYEPGHKFDFAVILEGIQGKRKSTFIEILGKRRWYCELTGDLGDRPKMVDLMLGKWICELPELSSLRRSEVTDTKAFVSASSDNARLSYDRRARVYPRRSILIGSTNDDKYLKDETGNRRFWPIACHVRTINTDKLEREIDQIWAEARDLYKFMRAQQPHGTLPLYLRGEREIEEAERLQETRRVENHDEALAGRMEAWLDKPVPVAVAKGLTTEDRFDDLDGENQVVRFRTCALQIWKEAMGGEDKNYNAMHAQSIGRAFTYLKNWKSKGTAHRIPVYGLQRTYYRVGKLGDLSPDEIRFGYKFVKRKNRGEDLI
jgi:predicted P-loop ATPase